MTGRWEEGRGRRGVMEGKREEGSGRRGEGGGRKVRGEGRSVRGDLLLGCGLCQRLSSILANS